MHPDPKMMTPVANPQTSAASADKVCPLKEGDRAPSATLCKPDGQAVMLASLYAQKPSVVIFYRGG